MRCNIAAIGVTPLLPEQLDLTRCSYVCPHSRRIRYKIIAAIGVKIAKITPSRGFAIELGSAMMVIIGTRLEIPLSTTHCQVRGGRRRHMRIAPELCYRCCCCRCRCCIWSSYHYRCSVVILLRLLCDATVSLAVLLLKRTSPAGLAHTHICHFCRVRFFFARAISINSIQAICHISHIPDTFSGIIHVQTPKKKQVGATTGVALLEGTGGVNKAVLGKTVFGWIITIVVCAISCSVLFAQGAYAPYVYDTIDLPASVDA